MILNKIEFLLMNNPVRALIQDKIEAKRLRKLSSLSRNKTILEIGCGNGKGTNLIKKYFSPKRVFAIDLDPRMIAIAKKRNKDKNISFRVASATKLPYKNNQFDAIIDFGIIHHIPNWKDCLKELKRVLKPEGELLVEDLSIETFTRGVGNIYRRILDHPYKDMYTHEEFIQHLTEIGFKIKKQERHNPLGLIRYFVIAAKKGRS